MRCGFKLAHYENDNARQACGELRICRINRRRLRDDLSGAPLPLPISPPCRSSAATCGCCGSRCAGSANGPSHGLSRGGFQRRRKGTFERCSAVSAVRALRAIHHAAPALSSSARICFCALLATPRLLSTARSDFSASADTQRWPGQHGGAAFSGTRNTSRINSLHNTQYSFYFCHSFVKAVN